VFDLQHFTIDSCLLLCHSSCRQNGICPVSFDMLSKNGKNRSTGCFQHVATTCCWCGWALRRGRNTAARWIKLHEGALAAWYESRLYRECRIGPAPCEHLPRAAGRHRDSRTRTGRNVADKNTFQCHKWKCGVQSRSSVSFVLNLSNALTTSLTDQNNQCRVRVHFRLLSKTRA